MELNYKMIFALLGILITSIGYFSYIKDILKGENKPHLFSWIIWSLSLIIGFGIQFNNEAGFGSYVTLIEALFCVFIAFLAIKTGEKNITSLDKISLVFGLISIIFWLILKQPFISVILIILIDLFGFIPTFRKSYINPFEESISVYFAGGIIFTFSIIGLSNYIFLTYAYPLAIIVFDTILMLMILYRRKIVGKNLEQQKDKIS